MITVRKEGVGGTKGKMGSEEGREWAGNVYPSHPSAHHRDGLT